MRRWHVTILIFAVLFLLPAIAPSDPMRTDATAVLQPPSSAHFWGTDYLGRDVFSRTLHGGSRTAGIAVMAFLLAVIPGLALGVLAGWSSSTAEALILAILNGLLGLPSLLMALVLLTVFGQGSLQIAMATGIAQIAAYALFTRVLVKNVLQTPSVEASRSMGATWSHLLRYHVLPGIFNPAMSYSSAVFAYVLLNSAALNFLGLGGEPGVADWGVMLADGRQSFRQAPWVALPPGIAISALIYLVRWAGRQ